MKEPKLTLEINEKFKKAYAEAENLSVPFHALDENIREYRMARNAEIEEIVSSCLTPKELRIVNFLIKHKSLHRLMPLLQAKLKICIEHYSTGTIAVYRNSEFIGAVQ